MSEENLQLPNQIIKLPLKEGEIYKNYKELCAKLGEKERTGRARQNQISYWQMYFEFTKKGHSYIIGEIIENNYKPWNVSKILIKDSCLLIYRRHLDSHFSNNKWKIYYDFAKSTQLEKYSTHFAYFCLGYYAGIQKRMMNTMHEIVKELWFDGEITKEMYLTYLKGYEKFSKYIELSYQIIIDIAEHKRSRTMLSSSKRQRKNKNKKYYKHFIQYPQKIKNDVSGLYRFINDYEEVIYVGQTQNIKSRITSHMFNEKQGKLSKYTLEELNRIEVMIINPYLKTLIEVLELYYINKYQPKLNIMKKYSSQDFVLIQNFEDLETNWEVIWKPKNSILNAEGYKGNA